MMIVTVIESIRYQLYKLIKDSNLSSIETLELSRELDKFLNHYNRASNTQMHNMSHSNSYVHANAINNILEVASKEKMKLPLWLNVATLQGNEWFQLSFIHLLLHSIQQNHSNEALEYIGENVPLHCIFPKEIQCFKDSIENLHETFILNHKSNKYIGEYLPYLDIKNEILLFCHTIHYPASFNYGLLKGLSSKFNEPFKIKVLDDRNGGQFKVLL